MDEAELAIAADVNLAVTWAALGRAMGADVVEVDSTSLMASGLPAAFFNGAFVGAPPADPEQLVAEAVRFFGDRGLPWLLWVRDGVSPATLEAGRAAGLRDAGGPPAMGLAPIPASPALPAGLTIEIATTEEALRDHASMLRDGFGMPQDFVDRLIRALWFQHLIVRRRVGIGHSPVLLVAGIVLLWRCAKPLARPALSLTSGFAKQEFDEPGHGIGRQFGLRGGQDGRSCFRYRIGCREH